MNNLPYIDKGCRKLIDPDLDPLIITLKQRTKTGKERTGEVVYCVYKILVELYGLGNFEVRSNALKVLDSAGKEYYRRIMSPYENEAIKRNGDV